VVARLGDRSVGGTVMTDDKTSLAIINVSASMPSGRVKVCPSDSVIESPFASTLLIVPVVALAKAPVEVATARIIAVAMIDFFIFVSCSVAVPLGLRAQSGS
jgi:hypothetical protein